MCRMSKEGMMGDAGWKCKLKLRCMHEYCTSNHYFFLWGGGGGGGYRKVGGSLRSQTKGSLFFWNCRCFRTSLSAIVVDCIHCVPDEKLSFQILLTSSR